MLFFCKYYAELAKKKKFCLTLGQAGSGVLSDPWPLALCLSHHFFYNIVYNLSNFVFYIYKKQHGARPCVEKMQLIFFVPPNEELEGTLHPQKFGCTPKNEGKKVPVC
jgi:hypothetical protein